jgi:aspartyl-tRNA(Asn)/glutamyl-tRNA(Gln) amidotransferase subunit A
LDFAGTAVEPDVQARFAGALDTLREMGTVTTVRLPEVPFDAAVRIILSAEAAAAFEEFAESGAATQLTAPEDRLAFLDGLAVPAVDYLRALRVRRKAMAALEELLAPFDALVTPSFPRVAPLLTRRFSEEPDDPAARPMGGSANLCGLPGVFLPAGPGREGLPTGITLTGRADGDAALLAVGIAFQERTDWHVQHPLSQDTYLLGQRSGPH